MATIRASCFDCGDIELTTADVHVRVCTLDNQGTYSFRCPMCTMVIVKPAGPRTVDLLVASGVSYSTWSLPLELSEPRSFGDPIDHDELLDFHNQMEDDDVFATALRGIGVVDLEPGPEEPPPQQVLPGRRDWFADLGRPKQEHLRPNGNPAMRAASRTPQRDKE